jgi:hypothetical protein
MYLSATHTIERKFSADFRFEHISLPVKKWMYNNLRKFIHVFLLFFIKRIHKKMTLLNIELTGLIEIVNSYSKQEAKQDLPFATHLLNLYRRLMSKVEEINFFERKDIEEIFTHNLEMIYKIESTLRKKAFEDTGSTTKEKYQFMNDLSNQSINTIPED